MTREDVRAWLDQFRDEASQRLMFTLLGAIRFYSSDRIRQKLREGHGIVSRTVVWQRKKLQPKRRDLIVTALGGLAHSGSEYARLYADENMIYPDNVVPVGELKRALSKRPEAQAVVIVDDFVGTGHTLSEQLGDSFQDLQSAVNGGIKHLILLVCVGFVSGQSVIENAISRLGLPMAIHLCDPLAAQDQLFSDVSSAFPDASTRMRAKDVAFEYGMNLLPDAPLGYGDTQAAIVFQNKIPNNCPPILWKQGKSWTPLFRRT